MVFASTGDNASGYTAGRVVYAPSGKWVAADPNAPDGDWRMVFDLAKIYFEPAPVITVGSDVAITSNEGPVFVSRDPKRWYDQDLVASLKSGTKARVLTVRDFTETPDARLIRVEIETIGPKRIRGWVHASNVTASTPR